MPDLIIKNKFYTLTLSPEGIARSLIINATGEECLATGANTSMFSVTQLRPFNNEVKLSHPNKKTTWQARGVTREGDRLRVTFDTVPVKALITIREADDYISFRLEGFEVWGEDYGGLKMDLPPVWQFRLIQLPVKKRTRFGEWLNVVWDDSAAVNVPATSPDALIDSEDRSEFRLLYADLNREIRLVGGEAALIASPTKGFMDAVDAMEKDFGLPRGVVSRRSPIINRSVYWTSSISPADVDEHIAMAKKGGFSLMLIYYTAMFCEKHYSLCGNYDYNEKYPNGRDDLGKMLKRIKAAGITPGVHFLQTHIGLESRYVTPKADHRLGLKEYYTLSKPLADGDSELFVEEDPSYAPKQENVRILQFGSELIGYSGVDSERRCFVGIVRGLKGTIPEKHDMGQRGGVLDVSEYGATSCYINQKTSLQDEIALKLKDIYDAGFMFCYMDGSEGTNAPYEHYVPLAQWRVYRRFGTAPLFTEGAAKAHFSWHFQSGGNAFDIFPPKIFKSMIARHPMQEAPRMKQDFTRLDFGWWGFWAPRDEDNGIQPDMYEYGTSHAAAWDCPCTMMANLSLFKQHPRFDDIMEVMRRWEDVRKTNWLTDGQKEALKDPDKEFTLLINESGAYELAECRRIDAPKDISAWIVDRAAGKLVMYWNELGETALALNTGGAAISLCEALDGSVQTIAAKDGIVSIPAGKKRYLWTELTEEAIMAAFGA